MPVCGGNGMGFFNFPAGVLASFQAPTRVQAGNVALICHSGSVFTMLVNNEPRLRFSIAVSCGQEIGATSADYIRFAADDPATRVIALFLETVRDPAGFRDALTAAWQRGLPVLIAKVGRTEKSRALAISHSRALAGDDAAFDAVCRHHGAVILRDLDDLVASALLLSSIDRPAAGGLGMVLDSGGLREMLIDLAEKEGLAFAELAPSTIAELKRFLPPGLDATNPVDAAGPLTPEFSAAFDRSLRALAADPNVGMVAMEVDLRDHFVYQPELLRIAREAPKNIAKPFVMISSLACAKNARLAGELFEAGVPWINGAVTALRAIKACFEQRELARLVPANGETLACPPEILCKARDLLSSARSMGQAASFELLGAFGLPAAPFAEAGSLGDALEAARRLGYPVALKTAAFGVHHKTEVGGVHLGLRDERELENAYRQLSKRQGARVLVQRMAPEGVEIAVGMITDPQFGPMIVVSAGGKLIELLRDRVLAPPPFGPDHALRLLDRLSLRRLLTGFRGQARADLPGLASTLSKFSIMAAGLSDDVEEIEINPIIAGPDSVTCVDALVIRKARGRLQG